MAHPDRPTVLVIEDERDLADMYERWLGERYAVRVAYDGETALERLDPAVDVVVLDRIMPGLTGDALLDRIDEADFDCRVAVVSAVEPDFDVIEMGFDDYLTKPVGGTALLEVVEKLRRRSEYTEKMQEYFSLVSKKALLDETKTERERAESDRYRALRRRIDELDSAVTDLRSELLEDDAAMAFRDLAAGTGRG